MSVALALIVAVAAPAIAEEVAIIVHLKNPAKSMTISEVRKIYSDVTLVWPSGKRIKPYDLLITSEARRVFSLTALNMKPEDVAYEWANKKITNAAKNAPVTVKSETLMSAKVANDVNAIGYLPASKVNPEKVRVVLVLGSK